MIKSWNSYYDTIASFKEGIIIGLQKWEGCPST
jgi:hypothetical protein